MGKGENDGQDLFTTQLRLLTALRKKAFESIVGRVENAGEPPVLKSSMLLTELHVLGQINIVRKSHM